MEVSEGQKKQLQDGQMMMMRKKEVAWLRDRVYWFTIRGTFTRGSRSGRFPAVHRSKQRLRTAESSSPGVRGTADNEVQSYDTGKGMSWLSLLVTHNRRNQTATVSPYVRTQPIGNGTCQTASKTHVSVRVPPSQPTKYRKDSVTCAPARLTGLASKDCVLT